MSPDTLRIAIIGEYNPAYHTHRAMRPALEHAAGCVGIDVEVSWIPTAELEDSMDRLGGPQGVWLAPGSPYASFQGALRVIEHARTGLLPFLGTCGGFQHTLIEFARNVLLLDDAQSMEHGIDSQHYVVVPVAVPIMLDPDGPKLNGPGEIVLEPGSLAEQILGRRVVVGQYYCSFEANPRYVTRFHEAGLCLTGFSHDGIARVVELRNHPFFFATQFQPQLDSRPGSPHPLLVALLGAARRRAGSGQLTALVESGS